MKDFNKLIQRSYEAIKARGLINENTLIIDFTDKMQEELKEIKELLDQKGTLKFKNIKKFAEEVNDLRTVCVMCLNHYGFNPIDEFEKGVIKNEKRAKSRIQNENEKTKNIQGK
jgi:hypothetical protein